MSTSGEISKEVAVGAIRSAIGAIPFAGTAINEALFNVSARIKQKRLNAFVDLLMKHFSACSGEGLNLDRITSEEFVDLLESVIRRVVRTKKIEKLETLRDVLIAAIDIDEDTVEQERIESFLDIIERVDTVHMKILAFLFARENTDLGWYLHELRLVETIKNVPEAHVKEIARQNFLEFSMKLHQYEREFGELRVSLENSEINTEFYLQDLIAKGLVIDVGAGATNCRPLLYLTISRYGAAFFHFVTKGSRNETVGGKVG